MAQPGTAIFIARSSARTRPRLGNCRPSRTATAGPETADLVLTPFCTADFDGDGIPDCIDPDDDNDGVPDESDANPNSDTSETVEIGGIDTGVENQVLPDGSTMADAIAEAAAKAVEDGDFERAVAKLTNEWRRLGLISGAEKGAIQAAASESA